jgi:hypothetical protein
MATIAYQAQHRPKFGLFLAIHKQVRRLIINRRICLLWAIVIYNTICSQSLNELKRLNSLFTSFNNFEFNLNLASPLKSVH